MGDHKFTLLDVIKETARLTRARKTSFLVVFSTYTLALLACQIPGSYFVYMAQRSSSRIVSTDEAKQACVQTIMQPWVHASMRKNVSASQQEEFYQAFKLNCSMFEDPPKGSGTYSFINGSLSMNMTVIPASHGSVTTYNTLANTLSALGGVCQIWAVALIACVLLEASTNTPSYNNQPQQHRDPKRTATSEKLVECFRYQFSGKVIVGASRVFVTGLLLSQLYATTDFLGATARLLLVNSAQSPSVWKVNTWWDSLSRTVRSVANPLRPLFLPCVAVAALEPGVWGFKGLWRGIQVTRGNRWKCFLLYLLFFLWQASIAYAYTAITSNSGEPATQTTVSLHRFLWRSMITASVQELFAYPETFLVPVFYFFCISSMDKVATMA